MYMRHSIIVNSEQDHITIKLIFITTRKTIFFVTTLNTHWILLQCRLPIPQFSDYHCILFPKSKCLKGLIFLTGAYRRTQEFVQGGLTFFFFPGGAQYPLGPENPLKSIDFTSQEGGLAPIAPPLNTPLILKFWDFLKIPFPQSKTSTLLLNPPSPSLDR